MLPESWRRRWRHPLSPGFGLEEKFHVQGQPSSLKAITTPLQRHHKAIAGEREGKGRKGEGRRGKRGELIGVEGNGGGGWGRDGGRGGGQARRVSFEATGGRTSSPFTLLAVDP